MLLDDSLHPFWHAIPNLYIYYVYIRELVDSQYMQYLRWQEILYFQGRQTWNPSW